MPILLKECMFTVESWAIEKLCVQFAQIWLVPIISVAKC